jgi:excisionase family DNA binding protein
MNILSTKQAAKIMGITDAHLRRLLENNQVHGKKLGRDWFIEENEVKNFHRLRTPKKTRDKKNN